MLKSELVDRLVALLPSDDPDENWDFDGRLFAEIRSATDAVADSGNAALIALLEEQLSRFLDRREPYGRDVIGEALARLAGVDALPVLLRAAARDLGDDQDSFNSTIWNIFDDHPEQSRPPVLALVDSDDPRLRAVGVWALDFLLVDGDLAILVTALGAPDASVRACAVSGVGQLAQRLPSAREPLFAMLADPDPQVRVSTVNALSEGIPGAAKRIAELKNDPDPRVRVFVREALRRLRR
jgi:HEAT repeat protein